MLLTWTLVPNATQYHYYYVNTATPTIIYGGKSLSPTITSATLTNLEDATYDVYVYAYNSTDTFVDKTPTTTISLLTDNTIPTQVTGLAAVIGINQLSVSWNASTNSEPRSSGISHYILTVTDSAGATFTRQTGDLSYILTDLDGNLTYTLKVNAFNIVGTSSPDSASVTAQPFVVESDTTPPGTVSSVTTTITNVLFPAGGVVNLIWSAATDPAGRGQTSSGIQTYNARYGLVDASFDGVNLDPLATFSNVASPIPVFGLTNGTEYWFQVQAVDNSGNLGTWSTPVTETPLGPDTTAPPTVKFVAVPGNTLVQVAWTQVDDTYVSSQIRSGIKRYGINVLYADGSQFFTVYAPITESHINIAYTLTIGGVQYPTQGAVYVSVFAEDNAGNLSALLPPTLVVTSAPGLLADIYPPSLVTNIKVVSGNGTLTIKHNSALEGSFANYATSGLLRHDYRYTTDGINYVTHISTALQTSQRFSGFTNGVQYTFQVRGVDNAGNVGAWSEPVTGTPIAPDTTTVESLWIYSYTRLYNNFSIMGASIRRYA
jgi:predicted phage tail protein